MKRYSYYVCFSRQRYGTRECDQERVRADEMEERVVESLLRTLQNRELLQGAVSTWFKRAERERPRLRQQLGGVAEQIRNIEESLDRYFRAFEKGTMKESACAGRIDKLTAELTALKGLKGAQTPDSSSRGCEIVLMEESSEALASSNRREGP